MTTSPRVWPRPRTALAGLKPYIPGRSLDSVRAEYGLDQVVKLNQNENPLGPSPRALEAAARALRTVHLYPEGPAPALSERLAALWELPVDWIMPGNGSDEIFRLLAEAYLDPGDVVVVPAPSFGGYTLVAGLMGAEIVTVPLRDRVMDLDGMASAASCRRARLIFLCRPNNPTGTVFGANELRSALRKISPDTLVVVDEAYREFDESAFDSRALVREWPNLVVTRTFSKIYGLAGLRVGYGIAQPKVLAPLRPIRDPFSINAPAVAAAIAALDDMDFIARSRQIVSDGRHALYALFDRLGLRYLRSQANFVLFETPYPAAEMANALLRRGALVRPCTSFGLPRSLRVTAGTSEEIVIFGHALADALAAR